MAVHSKSWIFWLVLILIIIVLLAIFVGPVNSKFYEFSGIGNIIHSQIEDIANERIQPEYRLIEDTNEDIDKDIVEENEEEINIEPYLPPTFLSEVSVGEPSGTKRSKPEDICKKTLERIYKKKFSRIRPDWLRNPETNRKLELDC